MRGRKSTGLEAALLTVPAALLLLAFVSQHLMQRSGKIFRPETRCGTTCPNNLKQIGLGIAQYLQDNDENYPPAVAGGAYVGWADAIQPYLKSTALYRCPSAVRTARTLSPGASGYTDYWLNAHLSSQASSLITLPAATVMAGDGNDGVDVTDARYSKANFPLTWIKDPKSPAWRHMTYEVWATAGADYLFADGHVKQLSPAKVTLELPQLRSAMTVRRNR